ncbi:NAD(P)-dependent oxidoreductase [Nocardia cyriacigeorgica]|uniref:Putative 6-phosphogluconate dehydrogenase NAD-binding n=1 Tax=Nocardia cyriacigeorgica (strain GUH-2) TaxID=1127134 RepID=H6RB67_NOCCG|nr:NAD(P)-binding domain-containing protein [Nocardia cyriacigeorgica]AUD39511.1 WHU imine reductase 26 [synthetic construct]MBF6288862.1 NAD(P)-dependent oxidoreductase [Nocardia cyriacigeorgica]MBF6426935.1 NAD(P)-dependent oxidoreductase [Nocardia cyriacigeorgica]CCF62501.1 putative 6-phosphogluconate dehydrogenase NAD-binding [Nocardia cyriacigeorgica GUH-2]
MTNNATPVSILGLGLMGQALARAFLKAGHPTTVWNRTPGKADQLMAEGAQVAPTAAEAIDASSLTVICVSDYPAMYELLDASDLAGTTLLNLTSGDSAQARQAARWAEQRGAHYLDGAIMAIPQAIGTDDAVILISGAQADADAHRPTLEALGTLTYLGADHGLASLYDVAGLAMMWSVLNAWLQGTALLRTAGVDAATFAPFAQQMAAGVAGWLPGHAQEIDAGSFATEVASLDTHVRTMDHLIEECEAAGINAELPRLIKSMADRSLAAGHGAASYSVLIEEFAKPA